MKISLFLASSNLFNFFSKYLPALPLNISKGGNLDPLAIIDKTFVILYFSLLKV
jgi:hypothetical protein